MALSGSRRRWGKFINEFVANFSKLDPEQIQICREVSPEVRYGLMSQVFEHIRRNFADFDDAEKRKALNQLYLLVILENCDFDYRENILLAQSFSKSTNDYPDMKAEEWGKVSHLASKKLKKYLEGYLVNL